jgi:hypothetical protein
MITSLLYLHLLSLALGAGVLMRRDTLAPQLILLYTVVFTVIVWNAIVIGAPSASYDR